MKLVSGLFVMASAFLACSSGGQKGSISGTIEGGEGETIYLVRQVNNRPIRTDSSVVGPDAKFKITPTQALALDYYTLQIGNDNISLITDSTESAIITTTRSDFRKNAKISGSEATEAVQELNSILEPLADKQQELKTKLQDFAATPEAKASTKAQMSEINKQATGEIKKWIESNTNNPAALAIVRMLDPRSEMALYKDVTSKLKDRVGETSLYKSVLKDLEKTEMAAKSPTLDNPATQAKGSIAAGQMAPEIAQNDLTGNVRKLSDLKGKVVLVDFWASWCGPCRKENPFVVSMYKKYKAKGFEVFSVSLDNTADRWQQAVQQDGLIWENHVSDLKGWGSAAASAYGVRSIPFPVLIDKEGKILSFGGELRGENLEMQVKKALGV